MKKIDDFRLKLGSREFVPILIGGMGVDISTAQMALEAARLGGIGHISDAMILAVADRYFKTGFTREKFQRHKFSLGKTDKSAIRFDLKMIEEATKIYVGRTMEAKKGPGAVFVNCMEKLTMSNPAETLKARLTSAMDAGVDGITLSAGLHLGSFGMISDHPRFRDVKLGIIVSSVRALKPFLRKVSRFNRLPDYIIVEGPLAGGHLGFGMDWHEFDLKQIFSEVLQFIRDEGLNIPVIPAGGIFTGTEGAEFLEMGAGAVQVATRFTVTRESGLPDEAKQAYFKAAEDDVVVNLLSPTGYPMRMLKQTPAIGSRSRPNCEALGYLLDRSGKCSYAATHEQEHIGEPDQASAQEKICLCSKMRHYKVWTCGHYVYRLKDTTNRLPDGSFQILSTEHVFKDYQYSVDHEIRRPLLPVEPKSVMRQHGDDLDICLGNWRSEPQEISAAVYE